MRRSLLASTMSRLDSSVRKNGHCLYMRRSRSMRRARSSGSSPSQARTAEPKPAQPGRAMRLWPHEKAQGMARRGVRGRRPRADVQLRDLADRRRGEEVVGEAGRLVDQLAVGLEALLAQ